MRDVADGRRSSKPVLTERLVGGSTAAKAVWDLFLLVGKEAVTFHASGVAGGNYWKPAGEADLILGSLFLHKEFQRLFQLAEMGPLNAHFTGQPAGKQWNFTEETAQLGPFYVFILRELGIFVRSSIGLLSGIGRRLTTFLMIRRCLTSSRQRRSDFVRRQRIACMSTQLRGKRCPIGSSRVCFT